MELVKLIRCPLEQEILNACLENHDISQEEADKLEKRLHDILSEQLPFPNTLDCIESVAAKLKRHHYTFSKEPTVPISIASTNAKIRVPFSLLFHSQTFQDQIDEEQSKPPCISLPYNFAAADLEICARFLGEKPETITDLETWLRVRIAAERFTCDEETIKKLNKRKPCCQGSLEELEAVLSFHELLHPNIANPLISEYLCKYIDTSLSNNSMQQVCATLSNSTVVQQHINTVPIQLHLGELITQSDLQLLVPIIQNVVSLDVQFHDNNVLLTIFQVFACTFCSNHDKTFPTVWENTLQKLTLHPGHINQIPEVLLTRLHVLSLKSPLQNYSVLDGRKNLKELYLRHISDIYAAPSGCSNLEVFSAHDCPALQNISSLSDLSSLKKCYLNTLPIRAIPSGLSNLTYFEASFCRNLRDFSPLNGLSSLEYCILRFSPITAIPSGLYHLKQLKVNCCTELQDFSALNNLPSLEECMFWTVPNLTSAPFGCHNLKKFVAKNCPELTDLSGLNGAQLTYYTLINTPVDDWQPSK